MLLWNRPSMSMEPFGQRMLAFDETRGLHQAIPFTTTILALGHKDLGIKVHLLIPDWESGHSDLHPRHMAERIVKQLLESKSLPLAWPHDGGEALGSLGTRILGGHKLTPGTSSPLRLRVKVIDHHTNNITPWLRNTQLFPTDFAS